MTIGGGGNKCLGAVGWILWIGQMEGCGTWQNVSFWLIFEECQDFIGRFNKI